MKDGFEHIQPINSPEKKEGIKTLRELKNEMQSALMVLSCSRYDDEECMQKWVNENAENFNFAFDAIKSNYEDFATSWETDRDAITDALLGELNHLKNRTGQQKAA
jgi:hypothetical protein